MSSVFQGFLFIIFINLIIKFHNFFISQLLFSYTCSWREKRNRWRHSVKGFYKLYSFLSYSQGNLNGGRFLEGGLYFLTVCNIFNSITQRSWDCINIPEIYKAVTFELSVNRLPGLWLNQSPSGAHTTDCSPLLQNTWHKINITLPGRLCWMGFNTIPSFHR